MHRVQERFEQFWFELPALKNIDSGAVSHVQLSETLHPHEAEARVAS
jgi:hypothetical protein